MSNALNTAATAQALSAAIASMINNKEGDRELMKEVAEDTVSIITNGTDTLPGFDLVARVDNDKAEAVKTAGGDWVEADTRVSGAEFNTAIVKALAEIDAAFGEEATDVEAQNT